LDIPVLRQDPNTLKIPPGVRIPETLWGWRTHDCPSGYYLHMARWVCLIGYDDILTSPGHYYGQVIRTRGVIRKTSKGDFFLMPSQDITEGPEHIRIESTSSLPSLKDGEAVYIAGTFKPDDVAHAPGLGVLSKPHDIMVAKQALPQPSLLPGLQLDSPKPVANMPPEIRIAPDYG
jgi:hypothetical protein